MKNFISIILCGLLTSNVYGIASPGSVFEVRTNATAGGVNGGGYDSSFTGGQDYSQQPTADLVVTDGVLGAAGNTVTSILTPFVQNRHEGNYWHVTAGASCNTTGPNSWHLITAVDVSGVATLYDSAGTVGASCTGNVGGAMELNNTLADDFFETLASSNIVYIRTPGSGQYSLGEAVSIATGAITTGWPIQIIGYSKVRGDNPDKSTAPVINAAANSFVIAGIWFNVMNISFTGTAASALNSAGGLLDNIKCTNTSGTSGRSALTTASNAAFVFNSDFSSLNGPAINNGSSNVLYIGNYIHHSTHGIMSSGAASPLIAISNLFAFNSSTAIVLSVANNSPAINNRIINNTIYGSSPTGTGIYAAGGILANNLLINNILVGFSTAIVFNTGFTSNISYKNNITGNVVDKSSTVLQNYYQTALDPQFVSTTTYNFSVGTNMKGLGMPSYFGDSPSTGAVDMGGIQRIESATGSGGTRGYTFSQ